MHLPSRYEIFQKLPARQPTWVETATSLEDAKVRLKELAIIFPAGYFIYDLERGCLLVPCEQVSMECLAHAGAMIHSL